MQEPPPRLPHRIFAYGTLKTGQPNHGYLSERCPAGGRAQLVGRAVSDRPYPLIIATHWNLPFLLYAPGQGHRVVGEVYDVDDALLAWMDAFEGHPDVYQRDYISVSLLHPRPLPPHDPSGTENEVELCRQSFNKSLIIDDPPTNHTTPRPLTQIEDEINGRVLDDVMGKPKACEAMKKNLRSESASITTCREGCSEGGGGTGGQDQPGGQRVGETIDCWCYFLQKFPAGLLQMESYADYDSRGAHNKHYYADDDLSGPDTIEEALLQDCRNIPLATVSSSQA